MPLTTYTGQWTKEEAAHLLRRTLFGPTLQQINDAVTLGMGATISQLVTVPPLTQPLAFLPEETIVPYGFAWPFSTYPSDPDLAQYHENARLDSLTAWIYDRINHESFSLHEKMCLFWHNHFSIKATVDSRATFDYHRLIQNQAFGNFKVLIKEITTLPAMLLFLNGNENSQVSPNENFARELLELYTIGKGPLIAPGDYTNYTEQDVQEIARIMTGWKVNGLLSDTEYFVTSEFNSSDHDSGTKVLSYHFNNQSFANENELEYLSLIERIFEQNETARFICRKLYRWFVNFEIDTTIENTIISELADTLTANDFEVMPVLVELLSSEHFYNYAYRGAIIKNPLELIFSCLNASLSYNDFFSVNSKYRIYMKMHAQTQLMNMNYVIPPNVAGWNAYYQAPNYSQLWANASLIKLRFDVCELVTVNGGFNEDTDFFSLNHLAFLDALTLPSDPNQVIDDFALLFCPKSLDNTKKTQLKSILTNGLPDFEWTLQYNDYLANVGNTIFSDPLKLRISLTLNQLFKFPEFQTI